MRSINKVILIGNLTRDPEMRQTPGGQAVCTFSIATNREWISKDNKKHSLTEYHDLVAWAKLAEICQQHLKKGKLIYAEGYLKTRSWDTPEGIKKFKTEIIVQDMIILDKKDHKDQSSEYIPEENPNLSSQPYFESNENNSGGQDGNRPPTHHNEVKTEHNRTQSSPAPVKAEPAKTDSPTQASWDIDSDLGL